MQEALRLPASEMGDPGTRSRVCGVRAALPCKQPQGRDSRASRFLGQLSPQTAHSSNYLEIWKPWDLQPQGNLHSKPVLTLQQLLTEIDIFVGVTQQLPIQGSKFCFRTTMCQYFPNEIWGRKDFLFVRSVVKFGSSPIRK